MTELSQGQIRRMRKKLGGQTRNNYAFHGAQSFADMDPEEQEDFYLQVELEALYKNRYKGKLYKGL